jgi:hypothetical protein
MRNTVKDIKSLQRWINCVGLSKEYFFFKYFLGVFIDKLLTLQYRAGADCVGGVSEFRRGRAFQAKFLHIDFKAT